MTVKEVELQKLNLDPKRFQYKVVHGKNGETGSLSGVKYWNPYLSGITLVWHDSELELDFIVNGHNRYSLALKLGVKSILCRYIDAPNPKEARLTGALTNIAEGQGTAIDTAKFFNDSSYGVKQLEQFGINPKLRIVRDGLALSNLHKSLFDKVIGGQLPIERGVILGALDMRGQLEVTRLITQQEAKKIKLTNDLISEIIANVTNANDNQGTLFDLFGGNQDNQAIALARLNLIANVRKELAKNKKLYASVANEDNAARLEFIGNRINTNVNKSVSDQTGSVLGVFEQLKNQSGSVSDLINEATTKMMDGEDSKIIQNTLVKELNLTISKMLKIA